MVLMSNRVAASQALIEAAVTDFWSLGAKVTAHDGYEVVRHPAAPGHPLGDFIRRVHDVSAANDIVARRPEAPPLPARMVIDAETPRAVEAILALNDWAPESLLLLELPAAMSVPEPQGLDIRSVDDEEGWREIERLFRIDHLEEDDRHGAPPRPPEQTHAAIALRRSLGPQVNYLLAERERAVIGTIAVWVGDNGIGIIEDVFVHPDARGTGVATQMLRHAVAHARGRSADSILIGAETDDTPKHLYRKFGFRPVAVQRSYFRPVIT